MILNYPEKPKKLFRPIKSIWAEK